MAHAPQNDFEDAGYITLAEPTNTSGRDVLAASTVSAHFRAHLDSFSYSRNDLSTGTTVTIHSVSEPMSDTSKGHRGRAIKTEATTPVRRSSRKRESDEHVSTEDVESSTPAKKKRSTAKERAANDPRNPINKLVDSIRPGLTLVFIGLNPGLMTAATGR